MKPSWYKNLAPFLVYFLLGAIIFHRGLNIGFLSDFAGDLRQSQGDWFNFSAYHWNFYLPALIIYDGLFQLFHLDPRGYQAFHFSLIFINAGLVYLLAQALEMEPWQCWVAGLLSLFNAAASEAYFWLSTIPKAASICLGLMALNCLVRLRRTGSSAWGWGYLILLPLAVMMESTGLILPLMGVFLEVYCRRRWQAPRKPPLRFQGWGIHLWSFSFTGIFLLVRHVLHIQSYVVKLPWWGKLATLARTLVGTFFRGTADQLYAIFGGPFAIILLLFLLLLLFWAWRLKTRPERGLLVLLLLLWVGSCLPHTIGANACSRYFYFPGIFAALVTADVLAVLVRRSGKPHFLWIFLVVTLLIAPDLRALNQSMDSYLRYTRLYDAGISEIRSCLPEMPAGTRLVLIDFPDYLYSQQLPPLRYAIMIYRNALPAHLVLLYRQNNFKVSMVRLAAPSADNPEPMGKPADPGEFSELLAAPKTVAFRYFPERGGSFARLSAPPVN